MQNAFERYLQCPKLLLEGIEPLDFKPFAQPEYRLPMITAVTMPEGLNAKDVRMRMRQEWNIETDLGLGEIAEKISRMGLKGYSAQPRNAACVTLPLRTMVRSGLKELLSRERPTPTYGTPTSTRPCG